MFAVILHVCTVKKLIMVILAIYIKHAMTLRASATHI